MRELAQQSLTALIQNTANFLDDERVGQAREVVQLAQNFIDGGQRTQPLMFSDGHHSSFKVLRRPCSGGEWRPVNSTSWAISLETRRLGTLVKLMITRAV